MAPKLPPPAKTKAVFAKPVRSRPVRSSPAKAQTLPSSPHRQPGRTTCEGVIAAGSRAALSRKGWEAVSGGRYCDRRQHLNVVPANAGTHTPCAVVFGSVADAFFNN